MPQFQHNANRPKDPFFNTATGGSPKTPSKNESVSKPKLGSDERFKSLASSLKAKGK